MSTITNRNTIQTYIMGTLNIVSVFMMILKRRFIMIFSMLLSQVDVQAYSFDDTSIEISKKSEKKDKKSL